ncbi:VOC family protein [Marivirga sp. S37H4]|uniref:VOC family protein n=1 Tax=Marivirga aurantiaca TaxID=2802615 RepID=A0A935CBT8_9BACT|nr:VOC family protein [Marivirga aurantiaca]MBK6265558.1 VOC family protein [Marivirga aurantiaca]
MNQQKLGLITLMVSDYDEAINFYTEKLKFRLEEDEKMSDTKRWVVISPPGEKYCSLLLAKATTDEQRSRIGNQTGGRVFLFLYTNNFQYDYQNLISQQINIVREPIDEVYGTVAVFSDLYGNLIDLIEPKL